MQLILSNLFENDRPNVEKVNRLLSKATTPLKGVLLLSYKAFFSWFYRGGCGSLTKMEMVHVAELSYPRWWVFKKGFAKQILLRTSTVSRVTDYFFVNTDQDLLSELKQT